MLGYFGIYSQSGPSWFRAAGSRIGRRRFLFGILPHEIAALNAGSAAKKAKRQSRSSPAEQRRAA